MSLTSTLQIGRSALIASQYGLNVTGNNMANASNPAYSRQTTQMQGIRASNEGGFTIGRGVFVRAVNREVDEALLTRLRSSLAESGRAREEAAALTQLEGVLNELTDFDMSSQLDEFFNTWSDAANLVGSEATVVEQGDRLASYIQRLRSDLGTLRQQIDEQIYDRVQVANGLFDEVASLNEQIASVELAGRTAGDLRDRRDEVLAELSEMMDITVESAGSPDSASNSAATPGSTVNIFVGSVPIVIGSENRGVSVDFETQGDRVSAQIVRASDGTEVSVDSGSVGGLFAARDGEIDATIDRLDEIARGLIYEVNRVYAETAGDPPLTSALSEVGFPIANQTLPLNDPLNTTMAELPFPFENGGFFVETTNPATGATNRVRIEVDLDGIDATGAAGFTDDTSAADIVAALDAVEGISASFTADGRLDIKADEGWGFSFDEDSSGVLASLGIGGYFSGSGASDIGVRQEIIDSPGSLRLGSLEDGQLIENGAAVAIADLSKTASELTGGVSVREAWQSRVQGIAVRTASVRTESDAQAVVVESLRAQRDSVSGVSIDEESINLLQFQQQYQGGARLISTANELLNTLIALV